MAAKAQAGEGVGGGQGQQQAEADRAEGDDEAVTQILGEGGAAEQFDVVGERDDIGEQMHRRAGQLGFGAQRGEQHPHPGHQGEDQDGGDGQVGGEDAPGGFHRLARAA